MFFMHGGFNYDVEFKGGVRMQVELGQTYNNDEVATLLKEKTGADFAPETKLKKGIYG